MKNDCIHNFLKNPYQYLLFSLITLLLYYPFTQSIFIHDFVLSKAIFLIIIFSVIATFELSARTRYILNTIAFLSFILNTFASYLDNDHYQFFQLLGQLINFLFLAIAVLIIAKKIFRDQKITGDTLRGGISVYLMLGILWFQIYTMIYSLNSNAFSRPLTSHQLLYFSFVTLTTVGYGDISPISPAAMIFANLEAVVGQLYPAIIIARLVSLYSSSNS